MALALIIKKVKSFLLFFVGIWNRALCCFRRRRRQSEFVPLTQVGVDSNQFVDPTKETWSDWNNQALSAKPTTIQEHIQFYRQQAIAARQVEDSPPAESQENFFEDMTPTITKQTKLLLNSQNEDNGHVNRLSLDPEGVLGQELGEWEDCSGWEDQTLDWDAREALKQSRKQARQKKLWEQQQRRQEKFIRPVLGSKVSS